MDFSCTPEHELLRRTARAVANALSPASHVRAMMADARGTTDVVWGELARLGWQGLVFPVEHGGAGLGMEELAIVCEEMGRVVLPGPFLSTVVAGLAILHGADVEQRTRWLPAIGEGKLVATLAVLETSASWDLADVQLAARPEGGDFVLSGTKLFVPDAQAAELLVCVARSSADGTLTLVAIERGTAGVTVRPLASVDATRKLFAVTLADVRVPARNVLARDGGPGLAVALDRARVALAAEMCGGAERVLELTVEYAKVRRQFGQPIGSFQAIQHQCADMMVAVECAKIAVLYAAWAAANEAPDTASAAAMAKATASEAYRHVTARAIQVHGGIGFTWEHDLHLYYRRALASDVMFGDAAWNRERIAQQLRL